MVYGYDNGSWRLQVLGHLDIHAQLGRNSREIIDLGELGGAGRCKSNEGREGRCQLHFERRGWRS